ncbi:hypothetical protein [Kitasatospora sp. CB02891]|uniref:hypothetical protein n=1 Tax=Kitasatospora sp. CB02891 TaxID=2020329 RepID=UPI0012FD3804|nr:hypothetical protein [Kitasatospora sp. CB02891]
MTTSNPHRPAASAPSFLPPGPLPPLRANTPPLSSCTCAPPPSLCQSSPPKLIAPQLDAPDAATRDAAADVHARLLAAIEDATHPQR